MRLRMTALEFRRFMDGFGLAIMLLGLFVGAVLLIIAGTSLFGVRSISAPPLGFQGVVLIALGGGLRLLVRIDKRLEEAASGPEGGVRQG